MKKILITSIGRTGTLSLTHYLDSLSQVRCIHEKDRQDVPFLFLSQVDKFSNITNQYLTKRDSQLSQLDCDYYIEVNPYFRFASDQQLSNLGWETVYLVRKSKTYLESVYTRKLFSDEDYVLNQMPNNDDPYSANWFSLSRFQKLCWYYSRAHQHILNSGKSYYRFEEIVKDEKALKELLSHMGLNVPAISNFELPKLNSSFKNKIKRKLLAFVRGEKTKVESLDWTKLTQEDLKTYDELCVSLEKKMGYVL